MNESIDWELFKQRIMQAERFLLSAHVRPDGDSIGSELGMAGILRAFGKEVRIVNAHEIPPGLMFLDPKNTVRTLKSLDPEEKEWLKTIDVMMILDTSSWAQLGEMGSVLKKTKAKKMILDHHIPGDDLQAERFGDCNAEAVGTLVFRVAKELGVPITKEIGEAIFVAISTDTGWFRFSSVTPETYRIIAELMEVGVEPADMFRRLYEQESLARVHLIGSTLLSLESYLGGRFMLSRIMQSDYAAAGARQEDSEDIVNKTLSVAGAQFAVIMVEQKNGNFKLSFRSRCPIDCSAMAKKFNGGGHKAAAGGSIELPYDEAKTKILTSVEEAFAELDRI